MKSNKNETQATPLKLFPQSTKSSSSPLHEFESPDRTLMMIRLVHSTALIEQTSAFLNAEAKYS